MVTRVGNGRSNFLIGSNRDDSIDGRGGNDFLIAGNGNDRLRGGNGNDLMLAGRGNDKIFGGNGNDVGFGGSGRDLLVGGRGSDVMYGGAGNDTFVYRADRNVGETDYYSGGRGNDRLVLRLNEEEAADAGILADIAAFRAFIAGGGSGDFTFASLGLTVNGIERLFVRAPVVTAPANVAPVVSGAADLGGSDEDADVFISTAALLANASDADGDALSVVGLTASSGTVVAVEGGYRFTPDADDDGTVTFSYQVSDGTDAVATSAVLDLVPVNDAPTTAEVDLGAMLEDDSFTFTAADLLANAADIDGDMLGVANVQAASGTVTLTEDGYVFTPDRDDDTDVDFTYDITDGTDMVQGTAVLDITAVNDAPTTTAVDLGSVDEDTSRVITVAELLGNAADVDNAVSDLSATDLRASSGTVVLVDGGFEFTPDADDDTEVTFTYRISDGTASVDGSATLDLTPVNDGPVARDDLQDGAVPYLANSEGRLIDVLANDIDVDGDTLTIVDVSSEDPSIFVEVRNVDGRDQLYVEAGFLPGPPIDDGSGSGGVIFPDDGGDGGDGGVVPLSTLIQYTISDSQETDTATVAVALDIFQPDIF